jgi:hypothetical protein
MITFEEANELLEYNQETGIFTWKVNRGSNTTLGKVAGTLGNHGYWVITINKNKYLAHRIAWLLVFGILPDTELDHRNRIKTDNRISNLRTSSRRENCRNINMRANNTSGYTGVTWEKSRKKWKVQIRTDGGERKDLGRFLDINDAISAYNNEIQKGL